MIGARPLLSASVSPWVAKRLLEFCGERMRRASTELLSSELPDRRERGREMAAALAQLQAAAVQLHQEPVSGAVGPESVVDGVSTAYAAEVLEVSQRQVTNLLRAGQLDGRRVRGAWTIDPASLAAELGRRKSIGSGA